MFDDLQPLWIGLAAVIDTVLLLALVERRNWRFVLWPMVVLTAGAWLWHVGMFVHILTSDAAGTCIPGARQAVMIVMVLGLLIMPCAMLHGILRVWQSGLDGGTPVAWRNALAYLPLVLLIPIGARLASASTEKFFATAAPFVAPYVIGVGLVNIVSALFFFRLRNRVLAPRAGPFFVALSLTLLAVTGLHFLHGICSRIRKNAGRPLWRKNPHSCECGYNR